MADILIPTALSLKTRFQTIRSRSIEICAPLKTEDYVVQPIVDVSPPKWHLAHTTWFFEEFILSKQVANYEVFHSQYSYLFNSYYEGVGDRWVRTDRGNLSRPSTDEVFAYRKHVDAAMATFLAQESTLSEKIKSVIEIGLQHEQQHQELLVTDLKYILGHNPLFPLYQETKERNVSQSNPVNWLKVEEGVFEIGYAGTDFFWDNEKGVHKVFLHEFEIMDRPVTNGEYIEFIKSGGYTNFEHWLSEGWAWVSEHKVKAPLYWHQKGEEWYNFTLGGLKKVDLSAPVTHISFYEADAYAAWKGMRLPTEFEWEVACKQYEGEVPESANFVEDKYLHPVAAEGNRQFLGDVWEWTSSAYLPYPHFEKAPGAIGEYNGKFMVNQKVLRGGSCATPRNHIRNTYRNFFPTSIQWQFTGIRLARHVV